MPMNESFPDTQIVLAEVPDFRLGEVGVQASQRTIVAGSQTITLEPRVMQVLVLLAEEPMRVISRDEMIRRCWQGVVVGDDAIQRCVARLRRLAGQTGGFSIETLPKIGYRLVPEEVPFSPPEPEQGVTGHPPSVLFASVQIISRREEVRAFAELLGDDVTAALALNPDLEVAPRPMGDQSKAAPLALAKAAGVDYVVTGRLDDGQDQAKFRVQVAVTAENRIVSTEVHSLNDPSAIVPEDDLVVDVASRIHAAIMKDATHRALQKAETTSAWEAVIRSMSAYQRISTESLEFAISEARRAVALDPDFGSAHAALCLSLAGAYEVGGGTDTAMARESETHGVRALALDPDNPTVLTCVSSALGMTKRPPEGLELAERAVRLSPTHPLAYLYLARQYQRHGRAADAMKALDTHERVAPRFPWQYYVAFQRGLCEFLAGRPDAAGDWYEQATQLNPNYPFSWIARAIHGALTGDERKARDSVVRLRQLEGETSFDLQVQRIRHAFPDPKAVDPLIQLFRDAWSTSE